MNGTSLWAITAAEQLADLNNTPLFTYQKQSFNFSVYLLHDTLWITASSGKNGKTGFRTAFSPNGLAVKKVTKKGAGVMITLDSELGAYKVDVEFPEGDNPILHYTVRLKSAKKITVPYWPKDVLGFHQQNSGTEGETYVRQSGIRSGLIYAGMKKPDETSFLYFQNLTSINEYCIATETSVAGTVSGEWPEFGFSPPVTKQKPIPDNKELIISDAYVSFKDGVPKDQFDIAKQFMEHIAYIYLLLPNPDTKYHNYPEILEKSLFDIEHNKGCWTQRKGCSYLNAYVCDYNTPPEIMVQLAVLMPMLEYSQWSGKDIYSINAISENLSTFYDDEMKTIMRWLPSMEKNLDESEEQKVPKVMDSWYLHHPLLNLSRMALDGNKTAHELFFNSIEYAIKVAHHFNYEWPVFYNMETLEILKKESSPGQGGEKDVGGIYAHTMLQAYEISKDKRYLHEAEKAAKKLTDFGFDLFYQANNTAFSAGAMMRLYKLTKNELYLNLSYLFIANLFKNVALWECQYGYGKNFPTFFALFPLNDAPYTAVYEEQECFAAINDFLLNAQGVDIPESISLLLAEFVRHVIHRAVYYYPPMLPKEMLSESAKTGELDPKLWIALEDIHDGWEKSGSVGQEVYGAGLCFGIVPRHFVRVPGQPFLIYTDYPIASKIIKNNTVTLKILGDKKLTCRLCIVKYGEGEMPDISVMMGDKQDQDNGDKKDFRKEPMEFVLHGDQTVIIKWD
ncbi:hypothetical protein ACFQZX_03750 [Mucilaginibacter litoreus]|uniref:Uncharacterized protein n=1 Tax=Mucilaginibacter litoreus TaxID=1048221 RepID=A0ABW3ANW9_9SPHI